MTNVELVWQYADAQHDAFRRRGAPGMASQAYADSLRMLILYSMGHKNDFEQMPASDRANLLKYYCWNCGEKKMKGNNHGDRECTCGTTTRSIQKPRRKKVSHAH